MWRIADLCRKSAIRHTQAPVFDQVSFLFDVETLPAKWNSSFFKRKAFKEEYFAPQYDDPERAGECDKIAAKIGVDALVFVELHQFKRTFGAASRELATDFAIDMVLFPLVVTGIGAAMPAPGSGGTLSIAFVDGKTGYVLWGSSAPLLGWPSSLTDQLTGDFNTFPQLKQ